MTEQQLNHELGQRIRTIRKARKIRQGDVAKSIRMTRVSIVNIEKGRTNVLTWRLAQMAVVFGVEPWQIMHPDWRMLCGTIPQP